MQLSSFSTESIEEEKPPRVLMINLISSFLEECATKALPSFNINLAIESFSTLVSNKSEFSKDSDKEELPYQLMADTQQSQTSPLPHLEEPSEYIKIGGSDTK